MSMKIKPLMAGPAGAQSQIYPYTHERAVIDDNGTSLETKLQILEETYGQTQYLNKTTYEYNVEINNVSYIQLDYIEASSKAYIDTGIVPDDTYGVYIKILPASNNELYYIGLHDDTSTDTRYYIGTYNYYVYYGWGKKYDNSTSSGHYSGALSMNSSYNANQYNYLELQLNFKNNRRAYVKYWTSNSSNSYSNRNVGYYHNTWQNSVDGPITLPFTPSKSIWIGYVNDADSYAFGGAKIYNVQISNGTNIIRNYVPCLAPNGTVGMYELVNDVFYAPTYGSYLGGNPAVSSQIERNQPILLGKFACYDTNVTIEINSADKLDNYHAIVILATQNWTNTTNSGSYSFNIYGDYGNVLQPKIYFRRLPNSNLCEIYYESIINCKVLVHIQCVNVTSQPTDICITTESIPSDATVHPINLAHNNMNNILSQHSELFNPNTGGIISGDKITFNSSGVISYGGTALSPNKLAIGSNGIGISMPQTSNDGGAIFIEKNGSSESNNLVFALGNDGDAYGNSSYEDKFIFKLLNTSYDIYLPFGNGTLATVGDMPTYPTFIDVSKCVLINENSPESVLNVNYVQYDSSTYGYYLLMYPGLTYIFKDSLTDSYNNYTPRIGMLKLMDRLTYNNNLVEYKIIYHKSYGYGLSFYTADGVSINDRIIWLNDTPAPIGYYDKIYDETNNTTYDTIYLTIMYNKQLNSYFGSYRAWPKNTDSNSITAI